MTVTFPALHDRWLLAVLEGPVPEEPLATCRACPMCETTVHGSQGGAYRPDAKCCTYWPQVPNYLAGGILAEQTPAENILVDSGPQNGAARLNALLETDCAVPLGVGAAAMYRAAYSVGKGKVFGTSPTLVCPYFSNVDGGICTIWSYRESVCSTYFCKIQHGARGQAFWDVLKTFLTYIQHSVAVACALKLGIPTDGIELQPPRAERFGPEDLGRQTFEGTSHETSTAKHWGPWSAHRRGFYERCYEYAATLAWSDVVALCGVHGEVLIGQLRSAFESLQAPVMPERAEAGAANLVDFREGQVLVVSYRNSDQRWIDARIIAALRHFRGRRVADAVALARMEDGIEFTQDLLRQLLDLRILIPSRES